MVCRHAWLASVFLATGGCATDRAQPLPDRPASLRQLSDLRGADRITRPLTLPQLDRLVLLNNPDLRSARAQHQLAQAQLLQAGLLPNPSLSGSVGYLVSGGGNATAWSAGISEDIAALVTLGPRRAAANAEAKRVATSLLWQEWQIPAKGRLLFVELVEGERLLALQRKTLTLLDRRTASLRKALAEGTIDLGTAAPLLSATADAHNPFDTAQRHQLKQRHQLAALLGLAPGVALPLAPVPALPKPNAGAVEQAAQSVQRRRPDLVALQLGYRAQEANVRGAIRAQFPALVLGYTATQDNSRVRNAAPSITLDLPIFNRNQGNIAIARATRAQMKQDYLARLDAARSEMLALLAEQQQARAQLDTMQPEAKRAQRDADRAARAFRAGLIDIRSFAELTSAAPTRQWAPILLRQSVLEQQVALDTLVGAGLPDSLPKDIVSP